MAAHVPDRKGSRAFLVGVPHVADGGFEPLDYVDRNLKDLASALSETVLPDGTRGILPEDAIKVLTSPSQGEWLRELKQVAEATTDLLFVYFAGHGYRDPFDNQLYLMTPDADLDVNLEGTAVSWSHVLKTLNRMHFRHAVFILDCCNSGVAIDGRAVGQNGHYTLASSLPTKTQPTKGVDAGEGGPRSRFTDAVIRAMEETGRDSRVLTMQGLYDRLYRATKDWPVNFGDGWGPKGGSSGVGPDIVISRFVPHLAPPGGLPPELPTPPPWPPSPATEPDGGDEPGRPRLLRWLGEGRRAAVAGALALLLTVGTGVYLVWPAPEPGGGGCLPPLELRLMAGPETRAAVGHAVAAYLGSPANRVPLGPDDGARGDCRRTNITVYGAGTGETVDAFGATGAWAGQRADAGTGAPAPAASGGACPSASPAPQSAGPDGAAQDGTGGNEESALCADPLQDVGPQPDLVISGSSTELGRIQRQIARNPGPARVVPLGSAGYSPLVLAVPAALEKKLTAAGVFRTGSSWDDLLDAMAEVAPGMPLLRPDPDTSGTGLQHTVGLYEARDGRLTGGADRDAEGVERRLRQRTAPASDADGLLCGLDDPEPGEPRLGKAAALVSEKAVADFNLGSRPGSACDNSRPADEHSRLVAYYPAGVPALDLPLAEVRWKGARDAARRKAAVRNFRTWLTGTGSGRFLRGLVRGTRADGSPAPPRGDAWKDPGISGVLADVPVVTGTADGGTADTVVEEYTQTREPGQVLFLVDVSWSMGEGDKLAMADAALRSSLQRLGPRDSYGIRTYPGSARHPDRARTAVPRGTPGDSRAEALAWLASSPRKRLVTKGAAVHEVLERALRDTRGDRRPLIVLITDGDDRPLGDGGGAAAQALGREQGRDGSTGVLVLSVRLDGCTAGIRRFENPASAGCYAGRPEKAAEALAEQVANQVQGGASDDGP
ncbi:caspase family protein [Streptomyces sp. NPDC001922]|uniref:caspase family protein n=1 Tax=Streptomyces sp. NPDC001922 TaxID=3364624 RepID=UPI0036ADEBE2